MSSPWTWARTPGDTVLTQGSGGVSVLALQFARVLGARVIATTSTAEKAERLKVLGASEVINYTETPDWDVKARELTDGRGVDCDVEIGGPGTIAISLKAFAVGGHLSLIGASLSPSGAMLDVIADRPGHYGRGDQRRKPRRFRGNEPDHRAASLAPCDRPDIPVRRGQRSLAISKAAVISARS